MTVVWQLVQPLKSDRLFTKFTGSKIELLKRHISVFQRELERVSAMGQELELQLEELSNIINKKKTEEI